MFLTILKGFTRKHLVEKDMLHFTGKKASQNIMASKVKYLIFDVNVLTRSLLTTSVITNHRSISATFVAKIE